MLTDGLVNDKCRNTCTVKKTFLSTVSSRSTVQLEPDDVPGIHVEEMKPQIEKKRDQILPTDRKLLFWLQISNTKD